MIRPAAREQWTWLSICFSHQRQQWDLDQSSAILCTNKQSLDTKPGRLPTHVRGGRRRHKAVNAPCRFFLSTSLTSRFAPLTPAHRTNARPLLLLLTACARHSRQHAIQGHHRRLCALRQRHYGHASRGSGGRSCISDNAMTVLHTDVRRLSPYRHVVKRVF